MNIANIPTSPTFKGILYGIGIVAVGMLIFQAGIAVGFRKANFASDAGDNYRETFGGPARAQIMGPRAGDVPSPHGAAGRIVQVDLPFILLSEDHGIEKVILINDHTIIRRERRVVAPTELRIGDAAIIIGSPNDQAQVQAAFIRLLP